MNVTCKNCSKEFNKRPSQIKQSPNHFCSRSCAAAVNNKLFPKRKAAKECHCACGKSMHPKAKQCKDCYNERIGIGHLTLQELTYTNQQPSNRYARVRSFARGKFRHIKECQNCGYDKHIECCHIRPIRDFPLDTTLDEINSVDNLLFLCPNCHWEFDKGLLSSKGI